MTIDRTRRIWLIRLALLVALLALWEGASGRVVPEFFISRPSKVFGQLYAWALNGQLLSNAWITAVEAFAGFFLGSAIGIVVGIALARARTLSDVLNPFIMAFYSLPKIALAPLFILWLGIGTDMKIVLTGSVVFFLVFLNTYTGVRSVDRELLSILKLMGANERHLLTKVVIPSAITWVFAGLRISVPYALIGAIVGELMAANRGLGFLLADSAGQFDTGGVFAALIAIMALSFLLNLIVKGVEVLAMPWKAADELREAAV